MNRGEAGIASLITAIVAFGLYYGILYYMILDNLLVVTNELGHNLDPVKSELWWMFIGFGLILGMKTITKTYRYTRKDYCKHCGKTI